MSRSKGILGAVVLAAAALPACSSAAGAVDASATASLGRETPREVFGDVERLQFAKRIQVELPARLAVADVSGDAEDHRRRRLWETLEALGEDTTTWKDVSSLHIWTDDRRRDQSWFEFYRGVASRQQADLLLVAERREVERSEGNGLSFLNILLLPMLFLPTQEVTTSVDVHAAAIDVRNGLVYATCDHRGERATTASVAGASSAHREQADAIHLELAAKLREQLARKLSALERDVSSDAAPAEGTR